MNSNKQRYYGWYWVAACKKLSFMNNFELWDSYVACSQVIFSIVLKPHCENSTHLYASHKLIQCKLLYFSARHVTLSINDNYNYFYVHLEPMFNVIVDPEKATINYNSTFDLTCTVISMTVPTITWSSTALVGLSPKQSITSHIATHTSKLTLEQVKLNYTGTYTCIAVNEESNDTATADITIIGKEYNEIKNLRNVVVYIWHDVLR